MRQSKTNPWEVAKKCDVRLVLVLMIKYIIGVIALSLVIGGLISMRNTSKPASVIFGFFLICAGLALIWGVIWGTSLATAIANMIDSGNDEHVVPSEYVTVNGRAPVNGRGAFGPQRQSTTALPLVWAEQKKKSRDERRNKFNIG
jgi:integral membrane sensor domain MASE1